MKRGWLRSTVLIGAAAALIAASACGGGTSGDHASATPASAAAVVPSGPYVPVDAYDIKRDPAVDLQLAVAEATRTNKRILLEVGGEWCIWCHIMDDYFTAHPELTTLRDTKFITIKVNYSEENENKPFLSQYPKIPGYPHIFVLDSDGRFLHSQGTADLEEGRGYNLEKFTSFLTSWAPPDQM
jgi:thiol:disulfide interchange protein